MEEQPRRVALVTGAGRRVGVGCAVAARLLADGADPAGPTAVLDALCGPGPRLDHVELDLAEPQAPAELVDRTIARFGALDVMVVNHARSSDQPLAEVPAAELDLSRAVNARAPLLLVQSYAARHDDRREHGRIVLFTSGQHLGPMPGELPYAATKGALHQVTASLADALADRGVTVNCVNPGPVDTGYASGDHHARVAAAFPSGRWTTPAEIADVVGWLVTPASRPVTGQVVDVEASRR